MQDSQTPDVKALQQAYQACSLVEQIELILRDAKELDGLITDGASNQELRTKSQGLVSRAEALTSALSEETVNLSGIKDRLSTLRRSKVEQLKLGKEIERLRRVERLPVKEIAARLNLSESQVSTFLRTFDAMSPLEQAKTRRASIFETVNQVEELASIIYRQMARIEGIENETHVRYVAELRQTIKLAQDIVSGMAQQRQIDEIKTLVMSLIAEVNEELPPVKRDWFLARVQNLGVSVPQVGAAKPLKSAAG